MLKFRNKGERMSKLLTAAFFLSFFFSVGSADALKDRSVSGKGERWSSVRRIDLREARRLYDAYSALFVDARSFSRYREGTIPRALNVPLHRAKRMLKWLPADKGAPIVLFGDGPDYVPADKLARRLAEAGYREIAVFTGGYPDWKKHSFPVMSAPKPCRCTERYRPKTPPVSVEGTALYLDPEDENRLDARWIGPLLVQGRFPEGLTLIDVRPAAQYAKAHLPGAINVPYDEAAMELDLSKLPKKGPILFTCKHGSISADAWFSLPETLQRRSFTLDADVVCKEGNGCSVIPH